MWVLVGERACVVNRLGCSCSVRSGVARGERGMLRQVGGSVGRAAGFCRGWAGPVWCQRVSLCVVVVLVVWCGGLVGVASGFAVVEGPPVFSSAPGLPDGRVYELVSPADKNGNEAGGRTGASNTGAKNHYGYASPDGDGGLYEGTGPMGVSPWGNSLWFVSTKNNGGAGWSTHALMPRELTNERLLQSKASVFYIDPSQDLSHALLEAGHLGPQANESCSGSMFLVGSDPLVAGVWVERPSPGLATVESCGEQGAAGGPGGGTPDFSTVYFTVPGTLLGEDAARSVHAVGGDAWGLYEDTEGVLREAGVLPDGSLSPFGAVPAASGHGRNVAGNEVSAEGSRLFFVSPDPASCEENGNGGENDCVSDPPELYMREDAQRSVLVSRDELLGEPGGVPVASPGGIVQMANPSDQDEPEVGGVAGGSFVFASVDGSRAFFQSTVPLTQAAVEDSPGAEAKTYEFDAATGSVVFLPGVRGEILAVDGDGSAMAFLSPEGGGQPARLSLWSAAAGGGGVVTPVVVLPEANPLVPETRLSADGSVLVFQTRERLSASFNSGGVEPISRYDVAANSLGCLSCDPPGVAPRGNAELSILLTDEERGLVATTYEPTRVSLDERGISGDGGRIFFDSPDPLVPQDSNTDSPEEFTNESEKQPQGRDVYEWENGVVYLISTGESDRNSYLLDSSEDGDDVFFATTQSLVAGDTDGGYDVYDARVPRAGDAPAALPAPCEGSSCQGSAVNGPPVVSSSSFAGAGNVVSEVPPLAPVKPVVKTVKCRKGYVKRSGRCVKVKRAKKTSRGRGRG